MKLYFAGVEYRAKMLIDIGVRYMLYSFYTLTTRGTTAFPDKYFLDSGAHHFQTAKKQELDNFITRYIEWINKDKARIETAVELDVGNIYPLDKVLEWRKRLETETNTYIMPVWHNYLTESGWEDLCSKYSYVGFSGIDVKRTDIVIKMLDIAKKYKTKVHIFGGTRAELMNFLSAYSTDSTSWLSGTRFGMCFYFNGRTLCQYDRHKFNKLFRRNFNARFTNAFQDEWNANQWKLYADFLEERDLYGKS